MLQNRFRVNSDGKTSYGKQKGRKCKEGSIPFGEKVWYKKLKESGKSKQAMESLWEEGIWLGHARGTNEVVIGTREGVVKAWAIKRRPGDEKWDGNLVKEMQGTPSKPNPNAPGVTIPIKISIPGGDRMDPEEVRPPRNETSSRGAYLKKQDFEKYGYTGNCEGCRRVRTGLPARAHNADCRLRMEGHLKDEGNARWQASEDRRFWDCIDQEQEAMEREQEEEERRQQKRGEQESESENPKEKRARIEVEESGGQGEKRRGDDEGNEEEGEGGGEGERG